MWSNSKQNQLCIAIMCVAPLFGLSSAFAGNLRANFLFQGTAPYEMQLVLDDERHITGELKSDTRSDATSVRGTNDLPGQITLSFAFGPSSALSRNPIVYHRHLCANSLGSTYHTSFCERDVWVADNAPSDLKQFVLCQYDDVDNTSNCKLFQRTNDGLVFTNAILWSTGAPACQITVHSSQRKQALAFLRAHGIKIRNKFLDDRPDGQDGLDIPCGLEQSTINQLLTIGRASNGIKIHGSPMVEIIVPHGTIFQSLPTVANLPDYVARIKANLVNILTSANLKPDVQQGPKGGTDFLVTVIGHSPQASFPDGYWFKSVMEISFRVTESSYVPENYVDQIELHVIGTKIFRAPSSVQPQSVQFQHISLVDPTLEDDVVDSTLSVALSNILSDQLHGAIVNSPEGL